MKSKSALRGYFISLIHTNFYAREAVARVIVNNNHFGRLGPCPAAPFPKARGKAALTPRFARPWN
jgi:hypothetical protein